MIIQLIIKNLIIITIKLQLNNNNLSFNNIGNIGNIGDDNKQE